jgi:glycosyltransferase involved in cell wall biosynthesis
MVRVLSLSETSADFETVSSVGALASDASGTIQVETLRLGRTGDFATLPAAVIGLRRRREKTHDLVHAWGMRALTAAALGVASGVPVVLSPTAFPSPRELRWMRAVIEHRDVQVVCPTDTIRRRFVERGVPIARCHLLRPGVAFARVRRRRDDALRATLGLRSDDRVVLAPGESTHATAHEHALFAVTVLNVTDARNKLLVWGRGDHAAAVRRFAVKWTRPSLVDATATLGRSIAFEDLLTVADEVLVAAREPIPTLPVATCMAAGLPIVAAVTPTVSELLEDRHTALMLSRPSPRRLIRRLLDLREDSSLCWSVSDMARTEAYEYFSLTRFLRQFRAVYQQIAERKKVEVPQERAGAGARFHGRG